MRYFSILFILAAIMMATPAAALDLTVGPEVKVRNFYDLRTYHESHPMSAKIGNLGGWKVGLTVLGDKVDQVGEVRIVADPTIKNSVYSISQTQPWVFPWFGVDQNDYTMFFGHKAMIAQPFEFQAIDKGGDPVMFILSDGTPVTSLYAEPSLTAATAPVCKIKHMAIKKSGELKVKFTAPYDTRNSQIRIVVYNPEGTGAETNFKYNPPYQIVKNNGTIVPDKMKVFLPGEYTGRIARIEYRVFEDDGFMSRGITFFTLPSLEDLPQKNLLT